MTQQLVGQIMKLQAYLVILRTTLESRHRMKLETLGSVLLIGLHPAIENQLLTLLSNSSRLTFGQ